MEKFIEDLDVVRARQVLVVENERDAASFYYGQRQASREDGAVGLPDMQDSNLVKTAP